MGIPIGMFPPRHTFHRSLYTKKIVIKDNFLNPHGKETRRHD
jgi:hypothetical protein